MTRLARHIRLAFPPGYGCCVCGIKLVGGPPWICPGGWNDGPRHFRVQFQRGLTMWNSEKERR